MKKNEIYLCIKYILFLFFFLKKMILLKYFLFLLLYNDLVLDNLIKIKKINFYKFILI